MPRPKGSKNKTSEETTGETVLTLDVETLLKLHKDKQKLQREIAKRTTKLSKVEEHLSKFGEWATK